MNELSHLRIAFIGSGKVATELALIFQFKGIQITGVSSRNASTGKFLAEKLNCRFEDDPQSLSADLIIVATNDASVLDLNAVFDDKQMLAYTAGAVELAHLTGNNWGVFYPLQTFTSNRHLGIDEIPVLIEAKNAELQELLVEMCKNVGFHYALCSSEDRQKYHLAAVFINNFVNHLIHQAQVQVKDAGLNWKLLMPLLEETIAKLDDFTAYEAQTGPARRKDQSTIETHQNLLTPTVKELYAMMTKSIQKTYEDE